MERRKRICMKGSGRGHFLSEESMSQSADLLFLNYSLSCHSQERKEKLETTEKRQKKLQVILDDDPPPPWSPPGKTIPAGR